jgi:hypothetical protein
MRSRYFSLFASLISIQAVAENCLEDPIYAGTLLAFIPENIPPKQVYVSYYINSTLQYGSYNNQSEFIREKTIHTPSTSLFIETGITSILDISINIGANYSQIGNYQSLTYQDTQAFLGFQLALDKKGEWIPDIRFLVGENFPTGSYQRLNPKKHLTDSSGTGSYQTIFTLVTQKVFYPFCFHPFNINLNFEYITSTKTNVRGYSVYGGDPSTYGTIKPGNQFIFNFAFEFSLTQNFVICSDVHYIYQSASKFSGYSASRAGSNSLYQLSVAPGLEYNPSLNFNIVLGTWFTIAGKNSFQFITPMLNITWTF